MMPLDVRSEDSVRHCVDLVTARSAHIDTLINNAGMMHQGFAEGSSVASGKELFDINFFGAVRMT
jgi:short-subunit dehydrogenase